MTPGSWMLLARSRDCRERQFRLHYMVYQCGPFRTVTRDEIIGPRWGHISFHRANGYNQWIIRGRRDGRVP